MFTYNKKLNPLNFIGLKKLLNFSWKSTDINEKVLFFYEKRSDF